MICAESIQEEPRQDRTRVALYIRVSSKDQINNYSMDVQAERLKAFCKANDCLYRIYRDPGESGADTDRPEFQHMLMDAEMQKFELIIVDKVDRLCRSLLNLVELLRFLEELKIGIKSLSEPIDTSNPMSKYFLYQLGMFAEMERDWFRERSMKGRIARIKEGKWHGGTPPYGYDYNKKTGLLEVNQEEAEVVRMIFSKYIKFKSTRKVVNYLNAKGISTRGGLPWRRSIVMVILKRETYIGILKQIEMESDVESIIDNKVFEITQSLMNENRDNHQLIN